VTDRPVVALGELLIDLIVADGAPGLETAGTFMARDGGAPANVAVGLARLGKAAAFCGVVGADPFGDRLRAMLRANGVDDTALRSTAAAGTTLAFAWKDPRGDGHFRLLRMADTLLALEDLDRARIDQAAAIVVGSVAMAAEPSRATVLAAVARAHAAGVPVVFDINVRPTLWADLGDLCALVDSLLPRVTLLKLSLDDAVLLYGETMDAYAVFHKAHAAGTRFLALTDGARGAWRPDAHGNPVHLPAFPIVPVEPTGAGDAFTAALIARLIDNGWSGIGDDDLRYAAAAGALTATRPGAIDALPTAADVAAFLAQQAAR